MNKLTVIKNKKGATLADWLNDLLENNKEPLSEPFTTVIFGAITRDGVVKVSMHHRSMVEALGLTEIIKDDIKKGLDI